MTLSVRAKAFCDGTDRAFTCDIDLKVQRGGLVVERESL